MIKKFYKDKLGIIFLISILVSLILRLYLAVVTPASGDLKIMIYWGNKLVEKGPVNFYFYEDKEQLAGIHSTFWAVSFLHKWLAKSGLGLRIELLYKLVPIIADILNSLIIYQLLKKFWDRLTAVKLGIGYLFNPAVFLMSAHWGQYDSYAMFFIFASLYLLFKEKTLASALVLGLGLTMKPWPLIILPFILLHLRQRLVTAAIFCLCIFGVVITIFYPYRNRNVITHTVLRYTSMTETHKNTAMYTLNFWRMVTPNRGSDTNRLFSLPLHFYGRVLFAGLFLIILVQFVGKIVAVRKPKMDQKYFVVMALAMTLAFLAMYLFLTRMHERYLFFAVNLLYFCLPVLPVWGKLLSMVVMTAHAYNIVTFLIPPFAWSPTVVFIVSGINIAYFFYLMKIFKSYPVS